MASTNPEETPATPAAEAPPPSGSGVSIVALILPALNAIAILATVGFFYYTKLKYKRPPITEEGERTRLVAQKTIRTSEGTEPAMIEFESLTVNISANPTHPRSTDGTPQQVQGNLHYATFTFSIEIKDKKKTNLIEAAKPWISDQMITLIGKKQFQELATVQGRYTLRAQLAEFINKWLAANNPALAQEDLVTNVYFNQFIVQ